MGKIAVIDTETTWGSLNPVTRKPENSKAYNRKKMQNWKKDLPDSASSIYS